MVLGHQNLLLNVTFRCSRCYIKRSLTTSGTASQQSSLKNPSKFSVLLGTAALTGAGFYLYKQQYRQFSEVKERDMDKTALDPEKFIEFPLEKVEDVNHNTKKFRFSLPDPNQRLGLHVASCVVTKAPGPTEKETVFRPYTPISTEEDRGFVEFLIKHYPGGPMSTHIFNLKPGDKLAVKGPLPKYPLKEDEFDSIGMIAGGTGLTPMLQIIHKVLKSPTDKTKITLLFANRKEEDILMRSELEKLQKENPDRLKVYYTLDHPPKGWLGEQGYVSKEMVRKYLPKPEAPKSKLFVCGPDQMLKHVSGPKAPNYKQGELGGILREMGYNADQVYKF